MAENWQGLLEPRPSENGDGSPLRPPSPEAQMLLAAYPYAHEIAEQTAREENAVIKRDVADLLNRIDQIFALKNQRILQLKGALEAAGLELPEDTEGADPEESSDG